MSRNMNLASNIELAEAKERIRNEELDADFYNHYTDDRIRALEMSIE